MSDNSKPVRTENKLKDMKEFVARIATEFFHGSLVYPKKNVAKDPSKSKGESYGKGVLRISATKKRLTEKHNEAPFDPSRMNQNDYNREQVFAGLNFNGSIIDISLYLSQRLAPGSSHFEVDCGQFAMVGFLLGLAKKRVSLVSYEDLHLSGSVRILSSLAALAVANTAEEKDMATALLYEQLVDKIFDSCYMAMNRDLTEFLSSYGGPATYNSNEGVRTSVRNAVISKIATYESFSDIFDNSNISTLISRQDWLDYKGHEKVKDTSSTIAIYDLPRVGLETGALAEVICSLPSKFRVEDPVSKRTFYPIINIYPGQEHLAMYATGIAYVAKKIDATPGELPTEGGKRRVKILTPQQAAERIVAQFAKYFDPPTKPGAVSNITALVNRTKYIDITDANVSQGTGLQLASNTSQTVRLFPTQPAPMLGTKETFVNAANRDTVFQMLLYSLGYPYSNSSTKCTRDVVIKTISEIFRLFGKAAPGDIQYNTVPSRGSTGANAFAAFAAPSMHHNHHTHGGHAYGSAHQGQMAGVSQQSLFGQANNNNPNMGFGNTTIEI